MGSFRYCKVKYIYFSLFHLAMFFGRDKCIISSIPFKKKVSFSCGQVYTCIFSYPLSMGSFKNFQFRYINFSPWRSLIPAIPLKYLSIEIHFLKEGYPLSVGCFGRVFQWDVSGCGKFQELQIQVHQLFTLRNFNFSNHLPVLKFIVLKWATPLVWGVSVGCFNGVFQGMQTAEHTSLS